jgi:hypothetical protein
MSSFGYDHSTQGYDSLIPIQRIINFVNNSYNYRGVSIGNGKYQADFDFNFQKNKDKSFVRKISNLFINTKNEKILKEIQTYLVELGYVGKYEINSKIIGDEFFLKFKNTKKDFEEIERREKIKNKLDLFSDDDKSKSKTKQKPKNIVSLNNKDKSSGSSYCGA